MKRSRLLLMLLIALLSTILGAGWRLHRIVAPQAEDIKEEINYDKATGTVNILILGVDDVEGVHRSDTIAVAAVNIDEKNVKVMSLPRDTRVNIEGHGWQKINHAFAYGGVKLLRETVVNYLGLPINYHVIVNYDSFPDIVDMLGGVDISVKKDLHYTDRAGKLSINIKKGKQHMDGSTALKYVRFRHDALGDIGRVRRQQAFLKVLLAKVHSPSILPQLPDLTGKMLKLVLSDMPPAQALQLGVYLKDILSDNVKFMTLPGRAAYISGVSYWIGDLTRASTMLTSTTSEDVPLSVSLKNGNIAFSQRDKEMESLIRSLTRPIAVLNGDGQGGLSKIAAGYLQKLGVDVAYIGNAKHFDYHYSKVIYPQNTEGKSFTAARTLAKLCALNNQMISSDNEAAYVSLILGHDYEQIFDRLNVMCNEH